MPTFQRNILSPSSALKPFRRQCFSKMLVSTWSPHTYTILCGRSTLISGESFLEFEFPTGTVLRVLSIKWEQVVCQQTESQNVNIEHWQNSVYKMWIVCAPVSSFVSSHIHSNKTKPCLKKRQLWIKFTVVNWLKIPITEIKSGYWIMWLQRVHNCSSVWL
jgi:hypothetical protein